MRRLFPPASGPSSSVPAGPAAPTRPAARAVPIGSAGTAVPAVPAGSTVSTGPSAPGVVPESGAGRAWGLDELADAYAYPEEPGLSGQAWLRGNMVTSLDGAAHHGGHSKPLSSAADMRIFGVLRALADVVVVGAETVRQEGYGPARARPVFADRRAALGQAPAPAIAVITASLDLDFAHPLFTEPVVPTVVLTGAIGSAHHAERAEAARAAGAEVIVAGEGEGVDPRRAVRALAGLGYHRLLTEGGPRLLGQFAAEGVLDELCLTVAPLVTVGPAPRIMDCHAIAVPERFSLLSVLEEDGFLFTRYRRVRE